MGDECYVQGDVTGAMKYWESALEKEPDNCTVLNNIASCLVKLSPPNIDRAIELITKADSLLPDNPDLLDTWGEIMFEANRPKEAVIKFEKAIRIDKNRIETRKKIVAAYEACGMKEMAEAQSKVILSLEQKKRLAHSLGRSCPWPTLPASALVRSSSRWALAPVFLQRIRVPAIKRG